MAKGQKRLGSRQPVTEEKRGQGAEEAREQLRTDEKRGQGVGETMQGGKKPRTEEKRGQGVQTTAELAS